MVEKSCLKCNAVKVCSTWQGFRPWIGQVSTEHGNYSKMDETYKAIAEIVANVCYIYHGLDSSTKEES